MKKFLILIPIFLLSGCFSNQLEAPSGSVMEYDTPTKLYFAYPDGWDKTEQKNDYDFGIVASYITNKPSKTGLFANFVITEKDNPGNLDSIQVANEAVSEISKKLIGYKQEALEDYTYKYFGQNTKAYLHIFTGKTDFSNPNFRFYQTYITNKTKTYLLTLTTPIDDSKVSKEMKELVQFIGFSDISPLSEITK